MFTVVPDNKSTRHELPELEPDGIYDANLTEMRSVTPLQLKNLNLDKKLGNGAYGEVYSAIDDRKGEVAVKRNLIDKSISFIGSIRELDFLCRLKGHPYILEILSVSFGEPFGRERLPKVENDYRSDDIYFICEKAAYDAITLIYPKVGETSISYLKKSMVQILLGLEYLHSMNIIHRDLKPSNLLWIRGEGIERSLKLCDFGMSKIDCGQEPRTPRTMTSWYRAPEVSGRSPNYTSQVDMWSIGCIFFEMVSKTALLYKLDDDDKQIMKAIIDVLPEIITEENIKKINWRDSKNYINELNDINKDKVNSMEFNKQHWYKQLNLTEEEEEDFDVDFSNSLDNSGSLEDFIDLLSKLLRLNPNDRLTATQALNHPFFSGRSELIESVRNKHPLGLKHYGDITIINCVERKWAAEEIFLIYNSQSSYGSWYRHRILFQALDIFDRYILYCDKNGMFNRNIEPSRTKGQLHSRDDGKLRFLVCLYLSMKYFSALPCSFSSLVNKKFSSRSAMKRAAEFEKFMLNDVLKFIIYRPTVYEEADNKNIYLNQDMTRMLLVKFGKSPSYNGVNLGQLFKEYIGNYMEDNNIEYKNVKRMSYFVKSNEVRDGDKTSNFAELSATTNNDSTEQGQRYNTVISPSLTNHEQMTQITSLKHKKMIINTPKNIGNVTGRSTSNKNEQVFCDLSKDNYGKEDKQLSYNTEKEDNIPTDPISTISNINAMKINIRKSQVSRDIILPHLP